MISAAQRGDMAEFTRFDFERKAGKGAADVGDQSGTIEWGHEVVPVAVQASSIACLVVA
jgi:hypothetical protein